MKKVVAILLAGVLMLGASVTAFAAPSPSASSNTASITATSETGTVTISSTYDTEEEKAAAEALAADPSSTLESVVGSSAASGMELKDVFDVSVEGYESGDVTVTFAVPGVDSSSTVIVLHYTDGAWHQEDASLGSGTITVTFSDLSPVAIYVDSTTASAAGSSSSSSSSSSTTTSPATGEAQLMAGIFAVIAIAAAGMVISRKRMYA